MTVQIAVRLPDDLVEYVDTLVRGVTRKLRSKLLHRNVDSLSRYIQKHNEYSNWETQVSTAGVAEEALRPDLLGTQAQRRRWLRQVFFRWPGSPLLFFLYKYIARAGFLDGIPGLIYCAFQGIQFFHIKAKLYENRVMPAPAPNQTILESASHVRD